MPDPPTVPRADVVGVVVTHRPTPPVTAALLEALTPQVDAVVVVDNGSGAEAVRVLGAIVDRLGGELVPLSVNLGIAAAQNAGIAWARRRGARFVLLSDQDSLPAPDMVPRLLDGFARARGGNLPPAAVGPVAMDERNAGAPLLFSDHRWGPRRASLPAGDGALVEATFLIASGCLIALAALDDVGPMNESWFIDHIDLEWGLRARRAGYGLYGVTGAHLDHALGDRTQRIPGRGRDVHIHSPVRNYYMARNTILLIRSDLMSASWRWGYAAWITKYAAFYALAVPPRWRRARLLVRGLSHGMRGRAGALTTAGS